MPTGYTADVADGKITDFRSFALQCARAFGALITMRDEPYSAPIPEAFEPSEYHAAKAAEAEKRLLDIEAMTPEQIASAYSVAMQKMRQDHENELARDAEISGRYKAMLEKVSTWEPPTSEHVELKKFMQSQLEESIRFDCGFSREMVLPTEAEWFVARMDDARRSLAYYRKEQAAEIERVRGHNEWLANLRKSLPAP